jgi:hypothetical protein
MKLTYSLPLALLTLGLTWGSPVLAADNTIPLPAGTELRVRLTAALSTKSNENGDPWTGRVTDPIFAEGREIVPAESTVEGHVTYLQPAGRATGRGEMRLVAETISTPEGTYVIVASLENADAGEGVKVKGEEGTIQGPGKDAKGAAKEVGIGAAGGAAVGALAHGGSGALFGAGIGAVAGAIHSLAKKHKGAVLPAGTELTFVLTRNSLAKRPSRPQPTASAN